MEIRGIGIINVAAMFGVKSVRKEKSLDLVVTLKPWEEVDDVDRVGMEQEFVKVLGMDIPHITIPVRPGRDLARLVEVAAYQTKLKLSGQNAAKELNERLIAHMSPGRPAAAIVKIQWHIYSRHRFNCKMSKPMSAKKTGRQRVFSQGAE